MRKQGKMSFPKTPLIKEAQQIIERAKAAHHGYLSSGEMSDEVIRSTLLLAQLDPIMRRSYIDENLGSVDSEDVADVRKLISIVDPEMFRAEKLCMLNPTFGEASTLVGGADADLLIDHALIDIKTTKKPSFTRDYFNQLVGYYVLYKIGGVSNAPYPPTIKTLAIYYSRYAELYTFPVETVVADETLPSFIEWFRERAARKSPN